MAWSVDRLGRSLQDLIAFLGELRAVGCNLYLHQQGIDTTTPAGRALFQMLGVFAEFERAIIVERVRSGISRARAEGKHLGRPRIKRRDRASDPGSAGRVQGHPQGGQGVRRRRLGGAADQGRAPSRGIAKTGVDPRRGTKRRHLRAWAGTGHLPDS
jgi:DNA invertase Pin-like site-specific DNA recombinase